MDPYEHEPKERSRKASRPPERNWRIRLLNRLRQHVLETQDNWILKENVADSLGIHCRESLFLLRLLVEEGILAPSSKVPGGSGLIQVRGHTVQFKDGAWRHLADEDWMGWRGPGWSKCKKRAMRGRRASHRLLSEVGKKKDPKPVLWDGNGFEVLRSSKAFLEAKKRRTSVPVPPTSRCARCGVTLDFNGKNARKRRGHGAQECNNRLVASILDC